MHLQQVSRIQELQTKQKRSTYIVKTNTRFKPWIETLIFELSELQHMYTTSYNKKKASSYKVKVDKTFKSTNRVAACFNFPSHIANYNMIKEVTVYNAPQLNGRKNNDLQTQQFRSHNFSSQKRKELQQHILKRMELQQFRIKTTLHGHQ